MLRFVDNMQTRRGQRQTRDRCSYCIYHFRTAAFFVFDIHVADGVVMKYSVIYSPVKAFSCCSNAKNLAETEDRNEKNPEKNEKDKVEDYKKEKKRRRERKYEESTEIARSLPRVFVCVSKQRLDELWIILQ